MKNEKIKIGDTKRGFPVSDVPAGIWRVEKLRPFTVIAYQNGKSWEISISSKEWREHRKGEIE